MMFKFWYCSDTFFCSVLFSGEVHIYFIFDVEWEVPTFCVVLFLCTQYINVLRWSITLSKRKTPHIVIGLLYRNSIVWIFSIENKLIFRLLWLYCIVAVVVEVHYGIFHLFIAIYIHTLTPQIYTTFVTQTHWNTIHNQMYVQEDSYLLQHPVRFKKGTLLDAVTIVVVHQFLVWRQIWKMLICSLNIDSVTWMNKKKKISWNQIPEMNS